MSKHQTILIIDDDATTRAVLEARLGDRDGYQFFKSDCGPKGVKLAEKHNPHLILLDWVMPKVSGLETIKLLKANKKTKHIPVYMLTARNKMEDAERALALGAAGYFTKPIAIGSLSARVRRAVLEERSKRLSPKKTKIAA